MGTEPLDILPMGVLLIAVIALLAVAMEGGYRIGQWRHVHQPDEKEQPVVAMVASILGLLALVLGFTFNLAASRFDARRQVVLEEANAIGTAYLRTRLLPEPQKEETARQLREYVDTRLKMVETGDIAEGIAKAEALHGQLWDQADQAAQANSSSIMTGLFIQSLNEVIDMHAKRVLVGVRSRIPLVIWICVYGLSTLGMMAVGYECGLAATRRSPAMLGLVLAFGVVLFLIADLDRGHQGLLRVGQGALVDLQRTMQETQP